MCGICGIFDQSGQPVDRAALERMTAAIGHRGPDGDGFYLDREFGMGHRRLSIIDLGGGAQPIFNEDLSLQIVFNGEIYNFIELRKELQAAGHCFRTASDTEVIIHAYEQWGEECVNHLNGMFAFAIFDNRSRTLFLARDHLGIKPLYYAQVGRQLLFASEIRPLVQSLGYSREVDLDSLAQLFTFRYVPSPKTLFGGVNKLPPGHSMLVTARGATIRRFWNAVPQHRTAWREEDLIEEYQALLEDAVRIQLRSDVPLGLYLSSGIDSGVLLAIMSRYTSSPVQTFTIGFEGGEKSSEVEDARRMADRFGAEHHATVLSCNDYLSYFERYMADVEEPVAHEPAPAFYFLAQLTRGRVKVALTGQGADEPWAGYDRYLGVRLSEAYSRLPAPLTQWLHHAIARLPFPLERFKRGAASLGEPDLLTRFTKIYSFFSAEMKAELYTGSMRAGFDAAPYGTKEALRGLQSDVRHLDPLSQMLYIDTRANLPDDLLMVADKTSMANSLEVRVPFLDRRLVEFIESLPPSLKLRGRTGKYLHKRAMAKWLPRDVIEAPKKGFAHPVSDWLRGPMKQLVDDCLLSPDSFVARYFDQNYIRRLIGQHQHRTQEYMRHIYLLVSLELWHRNFFR